MSIKRISINFDHTITSCNDLCDNNNECVEFAFGRESSYLNRCDLYRATDCVFTSANNFDIYRPSKSGNCPLPLTTRTLIKSGWKCGDNTAIQTGTSSIEISLDECETLCIQELLCVWF